MHDYTSKLLEKLRDIKNLCEIRSSMNKKSGELTWEEIKILEQTKV